VPLLDWFIYPSSGYAGPNPMDYVSILVAGLLSFVIAIEILPPLIRKMREGGMVGHDVNKPGRPVVAELGGIAAVFAFSLSISLMIGLRKLLIPGSDPTLEPPYLAAIAVFFIAAMIGLIDDISNIKQRIKALAVLFAALPLLLVHFRDGSLLSTHVVVQYLPFGATLDLSWMYFGYWLVLVPIGVTGVANAMNMSAGYNGLESGQIGVVSLSLLSVTLVLGASEVSAVVFAAIAGAGFALMYFNRYPARVFVGDIGTLGLGAAIAAGVILGGIEIYGLVAIIPAFYEAGATFYYGVVRATPGRREACHNPVIDAQGRLSPPKGAERYTLAYYILSRRPMTEPRLVATLLSLYGACGIAALVLSAL